MSFDPKVPVNTLKFSFKILNFLGYNYSSDERKRTSRIKIAIKNVYLLSVLLNVAIYCYCHGLKVISKNNRNQNTLYGITLVAVPLNYLERMCRFRIYHERIQNMLFKIIHAYIPKMNNDEDNSRISKMFTIITYLKQVYIVASIVSLVLVGLVVVMGLVKTLMVDEEVFTLFMNIHAKNYQDMLLYIIWLYWTFMNFAIFFFAFHLVNLVSISFISVQFLRLKSEINTLTEDIRNLNKKVLALIVDRHVNLIKFTKNFNEIFGMSLQYMFASHLIMSFAFGSVFLESKNTSERVIIVILLMPTLLSKIFICYLSQMVHDTNYEVIEAIYESNWTKINDKKMLKGLLIIIEQKKCHIKARSGKIFHMRTIVKVRVCY